MRLKKDQLKRSDYDIIYQMSLDVPQEVYLWVKKTTFNKTEACLFIYHCLLCERQVSKSYLEKVLKIQNRTTLYNYIEEIKSYISDFDSQSNYIMDLFYDIDDKKYILDLRKKK